MPMVPPPVAAAGTVDVSLPEARQRPYAEEVRWVFAGSTAAIITAGAIYTVETNPGKFDANFYGLLLAALTPTLVYLLFVRHPHSTVLCGALLLGVTLLGWVFVLDDDPMRGVGAVLAFPITLVLSTGFAIRERAERELQS